MSADSFFTDETSLRDPFTKELVADASLHVAQPAGSRLFLLPRFVAASLTAFCAVLWSALRYSDFRRPKDGSTIWIAVHGEWTNRTRHLLELASADGRELPTLVLGRPRASLKSVRILFGKHLDGTELRLYRPISVPATMAAIPAMLSELRGAWPNILASRCLPPLGRSIGILYRLCLGQVYRKWWRSCGCKPSLVIYGHSGTADTSALELEQQEAGATTVHVLHGISTGHTFTGVSDILITRCGHDAEWHARLGGYGKAIWVAEDRPALSGGTAKWALYTNYAHPTAFAEEERAIAFEEQAIDCLGSAARRLGKPAADIEYRPHPALRMLSAGAQKRALERASQAGFDISMTQRALADFELVLTTPSTIVQDALCAGTIPLVIDLAGVDSDSVYGAYPFTCRSEEELVQTLLKIEGDRWESFSCGWDAVRPGAMPSLGLLADIASH